MAGAGVTGFLQNLSGGEMIVILIVALVVLGPERLPEMARGAGRMAHKLKTMTEGLQSEVRDVMEDPSMQPLRELGELAVRPRQKLTEYALEAEAEERSRKEAAAHAEHRAAVEEADAADAQPTEPAGGSADDPADAPADAPTTRLGPLVAAVEQQAARARAEQPGEAERPEETERPGEVQQGDETEQGGAEDDARP
jgi:sec-independent protein translocase protein TatB